MNEPGCDRDLRSAQGRPVYRTPRIPVDVYAIRSRRFVGAYRGI